MSFAMVWRLETRTTPSGFSEKKRSIDSDELMGLACAESAGIKPNRNSENIPKTKRFIREELRLIQCSPFLMRLQRIERMLYGRYRYRGRRCQPVGSSSSSRREAGRYFSKRTKKSRSSKDHLLFEPVVFLPNVCTFSKALSEITPKNDRAFAGLSWVFSSL